MPYFQWQIVKIITLIAVFSLVVNFWNNREFKNRFIKEAVWLIGMVIFIYVLDSLFRLVMSRSAYEAMEGVAKPIYIAIVIISILGWLGYHLFRLLRAIFYWVESIEKKHGQEMEKNEPED